MTQVDRCYQLPLPFRKKDQRWPNNRVHAKMRLQGSKERFMKDGKFFNDYSNFIEDLLQEGYAERSPNASMVTKSTSYIMAYPTQLSQEK